MLCHQRSRKYAKLKYKLLDNNTTVSMLDGVFGFCPVRFSVILLTAHVDAPGCQMK